MPGKLKELFVDKRDGSLNGWFYVLLYFVLTHVFFWKFLVPGQMVFGTDIQNQSFPLQHMAVNQMLSSGDVMLWNPYIFSGMPFLASFSFPFFYPGALLFFILPLGFAMGYEMVLHFFLMGVFMYAFLRHLKLSRQAAFVGGLMFMFNAHLISLVYPGHGGKIFTMTYLPLALMALDRGFREKPYYNFAIFGLLVGLMYFGGHPQILFYCGIALSIFFVFLAVAWSGRNRIAGTLKLAGFFTASFALGALMYAVILFPALQYRGYTQRAGGMTGASSYEFASSFSQPPEDMLYLPLRNPFGWGKDYGSKIPTTDGIFYRGRIGLRLSIDYVGVFGLVLALMGAIFVRNRYTWFFVTLALLSAFLALGRFNPAYYYVYKYVPGFSLFRVPYAIMILLPVCWAVLSAYGLQYLMDTGGKGRGTMHFVSAGAGLALAVMGAAAYCNGRPAAIIDRLLGYDWVRQMLWGYYGDISERFRSFINNLVVFGVLLAGSMLILLVYRKGWLPRKYIALVAVVFILADLWPVGWEFIKTVPVSSTEGVYFVETPAIKTVKADKDGRFRVFSMVTNNELLYYGIESMTGYHAVVLGYYERMLDRVDFAGPVLDLMNARYMMLPKNPEYDLTRMPELAAGGALAGKYELVYDKDMYLYKNRSAMSAARLVNTIWVANDLDQALDVISDRRFQPGLAAVVSEKPEFTIAAGADLSGQKIEETLFSPDRLRYKVHAPASSFMVFSEVWYPGWKAYVDGAETKIYRTDFLLRGIAVPGGEHEVEMVFDPPLYKVGAGVSLLTLCVLVFLIARGYREQALADKGHAGNITKGGHGQAG